MTAKHTLNQSDPNQPDLVQPDKAQTANTIHLIDKAGFDAWLAARTAVQRAAIAAQKFKPEAHSLAILPEGDGFAVAAGVKDLAQLSTWCLGKLAESLPTGNYRLQPAGGGECQPGKALIGWVLGQYRFERYRSENGGDGPRILLTKQAKAIAPALAERALMQPAPLLASM